MRAAQQRWQAAAEAFDRAAAADARRTDARLWAGAAWAMTGSREQSMQSVAPALQADPYREGPGVPPLWPGDGLKGAAERLVLLSKDDCDGRAAPRRGRAPRPSGRRDRRRGAGGPHPQDRRDPGGGAGVEVHPARRPGRQRGGARTCAGGGGLRRADQRLRPVRPRLGAPGHRGRRGRPACAPRGAEPEPGTARGPGPARGAGGPLRGHRVRPGTTPACHRRSIRSTPRPGGPCTFCRRRVDRTRCGCWSSEAVGASTRSHGSWRRARSSPRCSARPGNPGTAALARERAR